MKFLGCCHFLLLFIPFASLETFSSSSSSEPSSGFQETFEKRCPPGLWCGKKRQVTEEETKAKQQVNVFEKRCPPGLWCGRKREAKDLSSSKSTERVKVDNMAYQFEKRCPPGLWCGKKREVSDQNLNNAPTTEDINRQTRIKTFEKRCPPGLWCGKKREVADVVSNRKSTETGDVNNMAGRFEKRCPPGLWCGKKREVSDQILKNAEHTEDMNEQTPIKSFEKRCPPGLWCGNETIYEEKRLADYEDTKGKSWSQAFLAGRWKLGIRIVGRPKPHMFCEEGLGKIKFRAFPEQVGPRILSLERKQLVLEMSVVLSCAMAAYITGMSMLILSVLQFGETRKVDSGEFKIQKDFVPPPGNRGSGENSNLIQRMESAACLKGIRPHRKCVQEEVEKSLDANNPHGYLENVNIRNTIQVKTFKQGHFQAGAPSKKKSPAIHPGGSNQIWRKKVQKSPCSAENRGCEWREDSQVTYRCPFGLWCPKSKNNEAVTNQEKIRLIADTSSLSRREQATSIATRNQAIHNNGVNRAKVKKETTSIDGFLKRAREFCTQGVGCMKSKANDAEASTKLNENQVEAKCPIGLWCLNKRELGYESSLTLEKCPPGLWCKRNNNMITRSEEPKRVNQQARKEACPRGLHCSFQREAGFEKLSHCPPGLWCKREEVKRENSKESRRKVGYESSVTMLNCPPGRWCKKDMTVTNDDTTESICPSGYECSSKRLAHYKNSDECPPGLWCKRRTAVGADRIINKYCSTGPWC
ncbi:unnamed protein product, partial [Porites evermanni]